LEAAARTIHLCLRTYAMINREKRGEPHASTGPMKARAGKEFGEEDSRFAKKELVVSYSSGFDTSYQLRNGERTAKAESLRKKVKGNQPRSEHVQRILRFKKMRRRRGSAGKRNVINAKISKSPLTNEPARENTERRKWKRGKNTPFPKQDKDIERRKALE